MTSKEAWSAKNVRNNERSCENSALREQKIALRDGAPVVAGKIPFKNDSEPKQKLWENGTPCAVDADQIAQVAGPLSQTSQQALSGLKPVERAAAILASPEFLRR